MDPPTYTALLASDSSSTSPSLPSSYGDASNDAPSTAVHVSAAASQLSLLLAPLEGRSTCLSGRLLPASRSVLDVPSGTVLWPDEGLEGGDAGASEVKGEVMTKGVRPETVERLCVLLPFCCPFAFDLTYL